MVYADLSGSSISYMDGDYPHQHDVDDAYLAKQQVRATFIAMVLCTRHNTDACGVMSVVSDRKERLHLVLWSQAFHSLRWP